MSEFEIVIKGKGNVLPDPKNGHEKGLRLLSVEAATEKAIQELVSQGAEITAMHVSLRAASRSNPLEELLGRIGH